MDFLFWLTIGVPLIFILYSVFLELSISTITVIAFKQTLNGLLNVLIASLLLIFGRKLFLKIPWIRRSASIWTVRSLAMTFIAFIVFIPSSITLHYFSEKDFNQKINYLSRMTENKAILARAEFEHLLWDKTREQIFTKNLLLEKDVTKYTNLKILESGTAYDGAGNFKFNFIPEIDPQFSTNQIDDAVYHYALNVLESSTSNLSAVHSETFQIFGFDGHIYSVLKSSTDNQLLIFKWNLEKIIFYLNNSAGDNSQVRFNVILEGDRSKQHSEYESSKDYAGLGVLLPKNSSEGKLLQWINAVFCREVKIGVNDKITITALLPARKMILDQQQDIAKDILLIITFLSATMIISIWLRRWIAKLTFHLAMEIQRIEKQHGSRSEYMRSSLVYELRWISVWLAKLHQRVKYRTAELEKSLYDHQQLIDLANAPIFGIDAEGRVNEWNQMAEQITGFAKDEVMGQDLVGNHITDDYKKSVQDVLDKALNGEQTANFEFPLFSKTGERIDVLLNSTTRRDSDGKIIGVVGVGQDITELNKVRVEQDRIANDLTQLIDTANAPIFGIDAEGRVNEWNQTAERITGFTKDEVIGENLVAEYITDDYKKPVKEVLDKALAGEQTANYEFPLFTNSGDRVDVLLNSTTRRDATGKIVGVVGVGQDITELKKSQAQVIHSSKLATLGEMATSVAHELNQPLNVIRLAAGNCRLRIDPDSTYLVEKLSRIEEQTARAALIIDHMKMFGRKTDEKPSNINVHEVIQSTFDLVGEQIRLAGINLREKKRCSSSKEHEIFVIGHEIQLEQVFINLITNARDALQTRGRSLKEITIEIVESLESIQIKIFDTGGGIPEKVIDQIFHPFFTTKEVSKGTGLGLSISYGIITDMGGSLECCNWEEGACFSIILPKAKIDEPLPRIKSGDAK